MNHEFLLSPYPHINSHDLLNWIFFISKNMPWVEPSPVYLHFFILVERSCRMSRNPRYDLLSNQRDSMVLEIWFLENSFEATIGNAFAESSIYFPVELAIYLALDGFQIGYISYLIVKRDKIVPELSEEGIQPKKRESEANSGRVICLQFVVDSAHENLIRLVTLNERSELRILGAFK